MKRNRSDRKDLKRALAGALALGLAGAIWAFPVSAVTGKQIAKDGEYTWDARVSSANTARWKSYKVSVTLTVGDRVIKEIEITPDEDFYDSPNSHFFNLARDGFCGVIQGKPASEETLEQWDAVSGATCASEGIRKAAISAIRLASPAPAATETGTPGGETGTPAGTEVPTGTGVPTGTEVPTGTAAPTGTGTPTGTEVPTGTAAPTGTGTPTGTEVPTGTGTPKGTGVPTGTAAPTETGVPTGTEIPTGIPHPTGTVTAIPEKIGRGVIGKISSPSYNKLKITWSRVKNATGYLLYRGTSASGRYRKAATLAGGRNLSYIDKNLTPGKTYYYKVCALGSQGGSSIRGDFSPVRKGRAVPQAPEISLVRSSGKTSVKWKKVKGASGYEIWRAGSKSGKYKALGTVQKTGYKDKKAVKGKVYYYKVRAYRTVNRKKVYGEYSRAGKAAPKTGQGR